MEKKLNELTLSELNLEIQGAVYNAVCDAVCDSTEAIADSVATGIGRAEELASDAERACECGRPPRGEDSEPVLGADAERPRPDGGDRRIRVTIDPPGQARSAIVCDAFSYAAMEGEVIETSVFGNATPLKFFEMSMRVSEHTLKAVSGEG